MEKIRVVIAEDEESYRKALRRTIELTPDIDLIAVCKDGREALGRCGDLRPDVLLTDIGMPHLDGLELMRRVYTETPPPHIVVLTVQEDDDTIFDAFRSGACGYVLKTSTPVEVVEAIRLANRGEAKITPRVAARLIHDFRRAATVRAEPKGPPVELSHREAQILEYVAMGMRNRDIALKLEIAEKTVKNHVSAILKALQVNTRTEAALRVYKDDLVVHN